MNCGGRSDPALFICPPACAGGPVRGPVRGPVPQSGATVRCYGRASGRPQSPPASAVLPPPPSAGRDGQTRRESSPVDASALLFTEPPSPIVVPDQRVAIARTPLEVVWVLCDSGPRLRQAAHTRGETSSAQPGPFRAALSAETAPDVHPAGARRGMAATAIAAERIASAGRGTGHPSAGIRSDRPGCTIGLPFADRLRPTKTWAGGTAPNRCDTACSDSRAADGGGSNRQAASRCWRAAAWGSGAGPQVGRFRSAGSDWQARKSAGSTGRPRDHSAASGRKGRKVMRCRAQGPSVPIASRWRSVP